MGKATPPVWTVFGALPGTDTEKRQTRGSSELGAGRLSLCLGRVAGEQRVRGRQQGK